MFAITVYLVGLRKREHEFSLNSSVLIDMCLTIVMIWPFYLFIMPVFLLFIFNDKFIKFIESKIK